MATKKTIKKTAKATKASQDSRLRELAFEMGIGRARAVIDELEGWIEEAAE